MAHREFTDSDGGDWVAYDVVPRADDRRTEARRQHEAEVGVTADRRGDDRRVAVGGSRPVRLTQGWLCFEKTGERRRLQPIPPNWHVMTDVELNELLGRAMLAPQRKRLDQSVGTNQSS